MPTTLALATLAGNLFDYWGLNFPHEVLTAYPGVPLETHSLSEWADLDLAEFKPHVCRDSNPPRSDILLTVNLFVRHSTDQARIDVLAQAALAILSCVTIPLYLPDSTETLVGYVQLLEARVQHRKQDLRQVTIAVNGIVQGAE